MTGSLQDLVVGVPAPRVTSAGEVSGAVHVVDLDVPVDDLDAALVALQARAAIVVGTTRREVDPRVADVLDLVLTELPGPRGSVRVGSVEQAVAAVTTAVRACPRASLVLAALLRQTALLPVAEALAAEASAYSTLLAGPEFAWWLRDRGPARAPRDDDDQRLDVERDGDVLRIRLSRVVRRNAFDAAMRVALSEALEVAVLDPAVRIELSGAGPVFSAGGDLDEFGSAADPATAWVVRTGDSPAHTLGRLSSRTEARVHGACAGAGVELPAFASRVVADPGTTFRLPELAMGLLPGAGGTVSLTRRIGRWRTLWLGLTGVALDAPTALEWGLVDALEDVRG
ncbi:MAG: enoyl-CoA hydratase/isomerase family protein [Frankiales bacterium]|nr:enoyl-CoA hydratase/isomerase family protein [Frankiales bacterium]